MKNLKRTLLVAVAVVLMSATASAGGFRWGIKAGVALNSLHFDEEILNDVKNTDNQAGFTGGLMCEFTVPVIGLGVDASVMYMHRADKYENEDLNRDYIEIPINLKYKISLPVVNNVVTPYLFTGPSFAFLTGKTEINEALKSKRCDVAWNFGVGVELFKHLQVGASYGLGITKAVELVSDDIKAAGIEGKNKYWTVTAAYLF